MARREVIITRRPDVDDRPDPLPPQRIAPLAEAPKPTARVKQPLQILRVERRTRGCGHDDDFKILKGEPAEFMAARAKKWASKKCPACIRAEQAAIRTAAALRRSERKRAMAVLAAKRERKFRLPDGAVFLLTYNEARNEWTGTLTAAGRCIDPDTPYGGVNGLMMHLGNKFATAFPTLVRFPVAPE